MNDCPMHEGLNFLDEVYCPMKSGHWDCPDPCPHAPALRAVVDDESLRLVPVRENQKDVVATALVKDFMNNKER